MFQKKENMEKLTINVYYYHALISKQSWELNLGNKADISSTGDFF